MREEGAGVERVARRLDKKAESRVEHLETNQAANTARVKVSNQGDRS